MNGMNKTEGMTVEEVMRRDKRFRYMLLAAIGLRVLPRFR